MKKKKSNLPKWKYDFSCKKCRHIQYIKDKAKRRDGDYCINVFNALLENLTNIGWAMLIFLCAYLANVAFSLWYNIKIRKEDFDREKLIASGLKILVFVVGLTLLCTAITALPIFANEVGWAIPDEYTDIFADLVIIGAVLLVSCKYIKEAFTKFVAILNTGSVENVENVSEPEATNAGKAQIGFMAGNGGNENE